jgi:hypothetical protein
MSAKEQTKFLGDEWRKLSTQQKQAYHTGPTHHGHGKTKSKSHRSPSSAKTKRGIKHHSHAKKHTKRLGHNHIEAHETVHHSHE